MAPQLLQEAQRILQEHFLSLKALADEQEGSTSDEFIHTLGPSSVFDFGDVFLKLYQEIDLQDQDESRSLNGDMTPLP